MQTYQFGQGKERKEERGLRTCRLLGVQEARVEGGKRRVVILGPNLSNAQQRLGTFHVHAEGCADIKRGYFVRWPRSMRSEQAVSVSSRLEVVNEIYGPGAGSFYEEAGGNANHPGGLNEYLDSLVDTEFHFAPCVKDLPRTPVEQKAVEVTEVGEWLRVHSGKLQEEARSGLRQWAFDTQRKRDEHSRLVVAFAPIAEYLRLYAREGVELEDRLTHVPYPGPERVTMVEPEPNTMDYRAEWEAYPAPDERETWGFGIRAAKRYGVVTFETYDFGHGQVTRLKEGERDVMVSGKTTTAGTAEEALRAFIIKLEDHTVRIEEPSLFPVG